MPSQPEPEPNGVPERGAAPPLQDVTNNQASRRRQGRIWMLTIPQAHFTPFKPECLSWLRGQLELGAGGFLHWQLVVHFTSKQSLRAVKLVFGQSVHAELTRGEEAEAYVWKEDTAVQGTRFELGQKPFRRDSEQDWDRVWDLATADRLLEIPASIRVPHYRTLRTITQDYLQPLAVVKSVYVFWGRTGTGKSRRAWEEAGVLAYPKSPDSKFWDGYRGQEHVVIDEFRGVMGISHLLRWLDRYPVNVEVKGTSVTLRAHQIWITSNLSPAEWYPLADEETMSALNRRFTSIIQF